MPIYKPEDTGMPKADKKKDLPRGITAQFQYAINALKNELCVIERKANNENDLIYHVVIPNESPELPSGYFLLFHFSFTIKYYHISF